MISKPIYIRFYTDYPTCNFSCPYCIAGHGVHTEKGLSPWSVATYNSVVENLAKVDFDFNIRIGVGGEFFVSKDLVDGARRLSNVKHAAGINLITNLSLSKQQYDKALTGFDGSKLAFVASLHPTEVADIDAWLSTASLMNEQYDLVVMLVAYPPLVGSLVPTRQRVLDAGLECFVQPYIGEYNGVVYPSAYTPAEMEVVKSVVYSRHDLEYLLNVKRPGICNAGYKYLYVSPEGKVFSCGSNTSTGAQIGDLTVSSEIRFADGPRPCPVNSCQCDTENMNTLEFGLHYNRAGINQHRYSYKFTEEARLSPWMDEWVIKY